MTQDGAAPGVGADLRPLLIWTEGGEGSGRDQRGQRLPSLHQKQGEEAGESSGHRQAGSQGSSEGTRQPTKRGTKNLARDVGSISLSCAVRTHLSEAQDHRAQTPATFSAFTF